MKTILSNKEMHKFLSKESKKLLPEFYDAYYPVENEIDGMKFYTKQPFKMPVNHQRRLYRIWKRTKDLTQINKYFLKRGFELKGEGMEPINDQLTK